MAGSFVLVGEGSKTHPLSQPQKVRTMALSAPALSEIDLHSGDYHASISIFGGGPRALTYRGAPLLTDYPRGTHPPLSAGNVLAPWPNRVADGVFIWDGTVQRLNITEPGRANAIHGFVAEQNWEVVSAAEDMVTVSTQITAQPGWPWPLGLRLRWSLDARQGLTGELQVTNESDVACPFGLGWHPYLSAQGAEVSECTLTVPVTHNLPLEPIRNLPAGPEIPAERILPGIRTGVALENVWLDHCFVDRSSNLPGTRGRREARLVGPERRGVRLWADEAFRYFQIYTADPARREGFPGHGRAIAVEPMTCPPDALRSGVGLIALEAGESRHFAMGIGAV